MEKWGKIVLLEMIILFQSYFQSLGITACIDLCEEEGGGSKELIVNGKQTNFFNFIFKAQDFLYKSVFKKKSDVCFSFLKKVKKYVKWTDYEEKFTILPCLQ